MRVRLLVGAAGFIGSSIVEHLKGDDDRLIAIDPDLKEREDASADEQRRSTASETITAALGSVVQRGARLELIYAAGSHPPLRQIADTTPEAVEDALRDVTEAYTAMREFARAVVAGNAAGSIVFISTVGAHRAHRYLTGYDAARAATESLVRSIALEYGRLGVTARALAVGPVRESASTRADGDLAPALVDLVPTGSYTPVTDIAAIAVALAGPAFDCVNGHTITADGGLTVQLRPRSIERGPDQ